MNHMPTQCLFVLATNMSRLKALNITKHTCTSTHTQSLTKTKRFRSGRVGKGSMVCSGGSSAFLQGHNMQKPQSTTHKLNKHDFWPGCQTLWLAASHKQDKNDFWPGCQTLRLAASHNWLSRLAARPCGWQAATTDLAGWLPDLAAGIQPHMT